MLITIPGLLIDAEALGLPRWDALPLNARRCIGVAGVIAVMGSMGYIDKRFQYDDVASGMRKFAERLQPFAANGHTIAVTEAGVLPLYSEWRTIDGLGLNDSYIAHHGSGVITSYFEQQQPDVIMMHLEGLMPRQEVLIALDGGTPIAGTGYEAFTRMGSFATQHHYTMAAAYGGTPCNLHVYWVRPGIADYDAILHAIRDYPYFFLDNGVLATDYRDRLPPPEACVPGSPIN
jgi:hypothetical protein